MYRAEYKEQGVQEGLQDAYDEIKREIDLYPSEGIGSSGSKNYVRGLASALDAIHRAAKKHDVKIVTKHSEAPTVIVQGLEY